MYMRPCRIKVISAGDEGCGKSCLIKRYCEEAHARKHQPACLQTPLPSGPPTDGAEIY